jgi:flavin-binding protein dodecin
MPATSSFRPTVERRELATGPRSQAARGNPSKGITRKGGTDEEALVQGRAVNKAGESIRQPRVSEIVEQDLDLDESGFVTFRTRLHVSFTYEDGAWSPEP